MKRVAVFGNAGGGKSTLSKRLAQITGLPLIALDLIQYNFLAIADCSKQNKLWGLVPLKY